MIDKKEIVQWSKSNLNYLALKNCVEWLKNAQPNERFPDQVRFFFNRIGGRTSFNTSEFAHFLGEFVEMFQSCVSELGRSKEDCKKEMVK